MTKWEAMRKPHRVNCLRGSRSLAVMMALTILARDSSAILVTKKMMRMLWMTRKVHDTVGVVVLDRKPIPNEAENSTAISTTGKASFE